MHEYRRREICFAFTFPWLQFAVRIQHREEASSPDLWRTDAFEQRVELLHRGHGDAAFRFKNIRSLYRLAA